MKKRVEFAVCIFCGGALIGDNAPIKVVEEGRYEHHCDCGELLYVVVTAYSIRIERIKKK